MRGMGSNDVSEHCDSGPVSLEDCGDMTKARRSVWAVLVCWENQRLLFNDQILHASSNKSWENLAVHFNHGKDGRKYTDIKGRE